MILPEGAAVLAVLAFVVMAFAATFPCFDDEDRAMKSRYMKPFPAIAAGLYAVLLCSVPHLWLATLIFAGPAYLAYRFRRGGS